MGTPEFAIPSLQILIDNNYNIAGVVTQPDKPKGRNYKITAPPVKILASKYNLNIYQPQKINNNEFVEVLKGINPDLIVVVAFGQILSEEILNIPKYGCINVHASLLPYYRGAAPIQWAIINGEKETGVTTMYMDKGMDTGDIILAQKTPIFEDETADLLHDRLAKLGAETLLKTIKLIEQGNAPRIKQDHVKATYAPMLKRENGNIDWNKSAIEIKNMIRGTYPWPGAYTFYDGKMIKIFKVSINNNDNYKVKPGTIVNITEESIDVQSGDGLVLIKEIQTEGGKRMAVRDYLIGHKIEKNKILCGDCYNGTSN